MKTPFAVTLALACSPAAFAQHAGDIALTIGQNRITTGIFVAGPAVEAGHRVFACTLGVDFPNFASSPGFDCLQGTFAPGSLIGFTIRGQLRQWNGSGLALSPLQMRVGLGPITPVYSPTTDMPVQGFTLSVASNGEWHRHLQYTLQDPATDGVYSLELDLSSNQAGLGTSKPFWLVFNQNRPPSEQDAAIEWIEANLAGEGGGCNLADIAAVGGTSEDPGAPDDQLTLDDILVFVNLYSESLGCPGGSPCSRADIVGVGGPPIPPDGQLTLDDILAFVNDFSDGC